MLPIGTYSVVIEVQGFKKFTASGITLSAGDCAKIGVFRPAIPMFTATDAVLPFPLRQELDRVDSQLDYLIYDAFTLSKAN